MKLKFIAACIAALSLSNVYSQKIKAGLITGINFNKLSGNPFNDQYKPNFHFGGFLAVRLCKHLEMQPELLFTKINSDTSVHFNYEYDFNAVKKVEIEYLYFPIIFNLKINKYLSLQGGPQANFLIHDNLKSSLTKHDPLKEVEIAGTGGLIINFKHFSVFGRYTLGVNTQNNIREGENWKNESIHAGIQYILFRSN